MIDRKLVKVVFNSSDKEYLVFSDGKYSIFAYKKDYCNLDVGSFVIISGEFSKGLTPFVRVITNAVYTDPVVLDSEAIKEL